MIFENGNLIKTLQKDSDKILLILIFIFCVSGNLILLATSPIEKYEISIYTALPAYYWISIIASIILCIILIAKTDKNIYFYSAFAGIVVNYTILLFLSFIRGYFLPVDADWDCYYHMGQSNYIESEGQISSNRYPMIHIFMMMIRFSGITNESMAVSITLAVYYILFLVIALYAVKIMFKNQKMWMISFLFFIPFLLGKFHIVLMPFQCALVLLLLLMCISFNAISSTNCKIYYDLIIIVGISLVFYHPLVGLLGLFSIFTIILGEYITKYILNKKTNVNNLFNIKNMFCTFIIILIMYVLWLIVSYMLALPVNNMVDFFSIEKDGKLELMNANINFVQNSGIDIYYKLYRALRIYGPLIIYFIMGSFGFLYIMHGTFRRSSSKLNYHLLLQGTMALIFGLILLTGSFIIGELERALAFLIILTPLLCGVFFSFALNNYKKWNKCITIFIVVVISFTTILGIFGLYYSPSNSIASPMVSYADRSGIEFSYINMEGGIPVINNVNGLRTWPSFIFGPIDYYLYSRKLSEFPPSHFGYRDSIYFGDIYKNKNYLITSERLKQNHLGHRDEIYLDEDFIRLNSDKSVDKVYSSDLFELWVVNPI